MAVVAALALILPLGWRGVRGLRFTVRATQNIYQQQVHTALFLRAYYPQGRVALNDIGAVSYMADVHIMDLCGLANMEVARLRREQRPAEHNRRMLRRLASERRIQLAIVYNKWFTDVIPEEWIEVAQWQIHNNVVCGDTVVSFYAVDPAEYGALVANLQAFTPNLPRSVGCRVFGTSE